MKPTHPFDAALADIDPATHRVTLNDIVALGDGETLNITVIHMGLAEVATIDLCLRRAAQERLTVTAPPGYHGPPVAFAGSGVGADGTLAPYFLGIEPCLCPREAGDGKHWNPLALALKWHPKLLPITRTAIAAGLRHNIADMSDRYCEGGLEQLLTEYNMMLDAIRQDRTNLR